MPLQMKQMTVQPTADMIAAQRQQEIASLLMQQALKQPAMPQGGMYTPKMGALQALAPAITGLLASRAQDTADTSTKNALTSQQTAQNQAMATLLSGGAGGQAPAGGLPSGAPPDASQPSAQPQGAGAIPGVSSGPNFMGALGASQAGVPPEILAEVLKNQAPTDKIKTYREGGMSNEAIARAISGEAAKDSTMTVGSDSRVVDPLHPSNVLLGADEKLPTGMRMGANGQPEWIPGYLEGEGGLRAKGATNVSLNTERNLYGTMADAIGKDNVSLYQSAQSAPEAIAGAQRIRDLVAKNPYTGTGAGYKLAIGKAAHAAGLNFADDDTANTEALASETAKATLNAVKASGLGSGQGFTDKDLEFLKGASGGSIALEKPTLLRLADLQERAQRLSIKRWNDTYSRLDPTQMKNLGMATINQPETKANAPLVSKLKKNADGTLTYTP
jgi:hypothetical protein